MEKIDISEWERAEAFGYFSTVSQPFYSVSFRQDVTKLVHFTKENKISFYYSLIYLAAKAINGIKAFLYSIKDDTVVLLDGRTPSFTDLKKDSENFYIVNYPCDCNIIDFCLGAKEKSAKQNEFICSSEEDDAMIYFSCLPWMDITALTNERDFDKNDSVPRVAWGKYTESEGKYTLCISVEVNHRLIDGVHIGKFAQKLSELIENLE